MKLRYENYGGTEAFEHLGSGNFMLMNNVGGYLFHGEKSVSRYQGGYFFSEDMYKAIEWIGRRDVPTKISLKKWCVEKEYGNETERFIMPHGYDGFIVESTLGDIEIDLDVRKSYDLDEFGRNYQIEHREDMIVITYNKKKDVNNSNSEEYTLYVVIYGKRLGYDKKGEWEKVSYEYDKKRGSSPFTRYVYRLGIVHCHEISIAYGLDKAKTVSSAKSLLDEKEKLISIQKRNVDSMHVSHVVKNKEVRAAYECCLGSLYGLTHNGRIFAGFPWFFQYWSRDELISLGGFKGDWYNIIMQYMDSIGVDGRIPNRIPGSELGSADGIGWLFLRAGRLLDSVKGLKRKKILGELHHSLTLLEKFRTVDDMAINNPLETWMDTKWENDVRDGFRIEIQALRLQMYSLMGEHITSYIEKERKLKRLVRKKFWNGKILFDGANDPTVRSNVFLAYYIYPSLLSKKEWTICFKNTLRKLWLDWGGVSTIDKKSKLFCSSHTGEDNKSYHRGDSWYFVNNIAAISLARLDKDKFIRYIYKILEGSTHEILYHGAAGCASEISSASSLSSYGCWNQAWSNSTYIEMVEELKRLDVI